MDISGAILAMFANSPHLATFVVVVGVAGYVLTQAAAVLPHPAPGSAWCTARNLLDLVAGNWGAARNLVFPRKAAALLLAACLAVGGLTACTAAQQAKVDSALASPGGQLFCAVETGGGGAVVVGLIDALIVGGAPVAILATGAAKSYVDAACAQAGGVAVSPPANPAAAPQVAVVVPPA